MNLLRLSRNTTKTCKICFKDIKVDTFHNVFSSPYICSKCLKNLNPVFKKFSINGIKALAIYTYNEEIKKLIFVFKGCGDYELKDVFISPFINEIKVRYKSFIIIPIPSSKESDINRGFNHVIEIFKGLNLTILKDSIVKIKNEKQSDKNYFERQKVKDLFKVNNLSEIKNKNILIVDDICTTGASLKSMVKLIKPFQPKKIEILVIAKREFSKEELSKLEKQDFILK